MAKPEKAVTDARAMAANGYSPREIAEAMARQHGIKVSRFTVRDWIKGKYRTEVVNDQ